jgi:hypothetical protein
MRCHGGGDFADALDRVRLGQPEVEVHRSLIGRIVAARARQEDNAGADIPQVRRIDNVSRGVQHLVRGLFVGHRLRAAKHVGLGRRVEHDETDTQRQRHRQGRENQCLGGRGPVPPAVAAPHRGQLTPQPDTVMAKVSPVT